MSAYVVSDNHINYLINFAYIHKDEFYGKFNISNDPQKWAQILLDENVRSVNSRYVTTDERFKIEFQLKLQNFDIPQVLKACDCYDYQACETYDYYESTAAEFVNKIRKVAISKVKGYEEAKWGID